MLELYLQHVNVVILIHVSVLVLPDRLGGGTSYIGVGSGQGAGMTLSLSTRQRVAFPTTFSIFMNMKVFRTLPQKDPHGRRWQQERSGLQPPCPRVVHAV